MSTLLVRRGRWLIAAVAVWLGGASCLAEAASEPPQTTLLYTLNTTCTLRRAAAVPCVVQAVDVGEATEYRHRIGKSTFTYRVFDEPYVRIEGLNPNTRQWAPARNATIHLGHNELCFNDQALCVVNPNYLNSVREAAGTTFVGRERMGLAFGRQGRVEVVCFDKGCDRLLEAMGR